MPHGNNLRFLPPVPTSALTTQRPGRLVGHQESRRPITAIKRSWMRGHDQVAVIGVESTSSFGAALTRALTTRRNRVGEVNRPGWRHGQDRLTLRL